ncbi:MAG: SPW repeat protein [Pseudonocardia sp.]|nr:SPW repeat protein [Pseudonocardia sp.]
MTAKAWTRWQDWAALVVGVLFALSPIVTDADPGAAWTTVVLGVLLALSALWSLAQPGSVTSEYTHGVLGVLIFIAPWVMSFSDLGGASWTAWVAGVLTVLVAATALPAASTAHRGLAGSH